MSGGYSPSTGGCQYTGGCTPQGKIKSIYKCKNYIVMENLKLLVDSVNRIEFYGDVVVIVDKRRRVHRYSKTEFWSSKYQSLVDAIKSRQVAAEQ